METQIRNQSESNVGGPTGNRDDHGPGPEQAPGGEGSSDRPVESGVPPTGGPEGGTPAGNGDGGKTANEVERAFRTALDLAYRDAIRGASAFCHSLAAAPENLEQLEGYFLANAPVLTSILRTVTAGPTSPLFTPKTNPQTGEINWDSVDSITSRYHRSDVQIRSSPTTDDWRSLYSVLVVWTGGTIEIRSCATQHLEEKLQEIRAAVRAARKGTPAA